MADHRHASLSLPSDSASVRGARTYVADVLSKWGLPDDAETIHGVQLIVSELATNAVQHTCGRSPTFTVHLRLDEDRKLHIGVTDSHPRWPQRLPAAVQQDNGRGMLIVRTLTAEFAGSVSVVPTEEGGKTVRVIFPWPALPPNE
ncbi:ATP-binding protein [Streptomyces minutiscleroticus]|uniref:ATP-binding protein n=1 Tax=Streptomyces minutiscleroticus TaxID=68238 RepID=A0A918NJ66_9ACTN|nr:ATP-binding protein [Streptomyces minutiscleroticus]GGX71590.1 ATP-binding protein [Streptomyces minutiscleroticus]